MIWEKKIINCVNKDENYLKGQFGTPTKVKDYDNGLKWVYYEEWGTYNTKKVGNTQYYTDYRFIKFKVDSDGLVEDYFVSDGYNIEYNANETVKTVAFWGEIATYFLIAMAIGL